MFKKELDILLKAILAGILIGIGGTVYLSAENKVVGSLMFAVGLFTICYFSLNLFTGKIGYLLINKPNYLIDLGIIWTGNLIGTGIVGLTIPLTRQIQLVEKAKAVCDTKVNDSLLSIFILAIFCGMLMYIAVETFKTSRDKPIYGCIAVFTCVSVFILCGFEHCIADMFYFILAGCYSNEKTMTILMCATFGNTVGAVLFQKISTLNMNN